MWAVTSIASQRTTAYLALDAYKFNVPNTEATLPSSIAPNGQTVAPLNTWTGRAVAELVEGLGGAVVATHSQSGQIGHHVVRILKEHGKLNLLKGLITDEGSCAFTGGGLALTGADFINIPYLAFKGDYTATSAVCQASVDAVKAAGGKADYIQLDRAGLVAGQLCWSIRGSLRGSLRRRLSHAHDRETIRHPAAERPRTFTVMDVMLKWADMNVSKPGTTACAENGQGNGGGTGAPGNGKGQGAANNNENGRF